jgi:hypothetical protein
LGGHDVGFVHWYDDIAMEWARRGKRTEGCNDVQRYEHKDIFPLRGSTFEGMPAKVPFAYANVLAEEYGAPSMSNTVYQKYHFDVDLQEWLPISG